jgi:glycosyltransferase involved in cell wall biosynthesis
MKSFFIGSLYPRERLDEIRSNSKNGKFDNAANNLQWGLVEGLDNFYNDLKIITQPSIGSYPKYYKHAFFQKSIFSHKLKATDYCLGFINVFPFSHLSRYLYLRQILMKVIPNDESSIVIIYAISSPFLRAITDLKDKGWNKMKTCLIVPDLPQYMRETNNLVYRILKRIDWKIIKKNLAKIDSFVLLNCNMQYHLNLKKKPWVLVEGIYNSPPYESVIVKQENKIVLYTGNLGERYGIKALLNAFNLIKKDNYRLWIRGNGAVKKDVLDAAKTDSRIKYFEEMPLIELQHLLQKATILVNPVPPQEEFSKYFFPSKIMNYMASGTPVLSTVTEAIPQEYYKHFFTLDNTDPTHIKQRIIETCEMSQSELNNFGKKAQQFIFNNKNPNVQAQKIYNMISKL